MESLQCVLGQDTLSAVNNNNNANDIVESWSSLFLDIIDKHLPLKQHHVKCKQQPKWLN